MTNKKARPTKIGNSNNKCWALPALHELLTLSSVILFSLILFPTLLYSFPAHSAEGNLQTGISAYEDGEYQEAIAELEAVITAISECEEKLLKKATDDASSALDDLFKEDSGTDCGSANLWEAHTYLAASYLEIDQKPKAFEQIEKAKSVNATKRPDSNKFSAEIIGLFEAASKSTVVATGAQTDAARDDIRGNVKSIKKYRSDKSQEKRLVTEVEFDKNGMYQRIVKYSFKTGKKKSDLRFLYGVKGVLQEVIFRRKNKQEKWRVTHRNSKTGSVQTHILEDDYSDMQRLEDDNDDIKRKNVFQFDGHTRVIKKSFYRRGNEQPYKKIIFQYNNKSQLVSKELVYLYKSKRRHRMTRFHYDKKGRRVLSERWNVKSSSSIAAYLRSKPDYKAILSGHDKYNNVTKRMWQTKKNRSGTVYYVFEYY